MALIEFVKNYDDLSTDRGFQFKFYCDKCRNGFMTSFQTTALGTAGSLLRAAGDLFGGWAGSAGNSAFEVQRMVGGPAHDAALKTAVDEARPHFAQCQRCAKWVCHHPCWNQPAGLCTDCAPDFRTEFAASHANAKVDAARAQLHERAGKSDFVGETSMATENVYGAPPMPGYPAQPAAYARPGYPPNAGGYGAQPGAAPNLAYGPPPGAPANAGYGPPNYGAPNTGPGYAPPAVAPPPFDAAAAQVGPACSACGTALGSNKFCPSCGTPARPPQTRCSACGHVSTLPTRFCGECGAKFG